MQPIVDPRVTVTPIVVANRTRWVKTKSDGKPIPEEDAAPLVDANLSPEAARVANTVRLSFLRPDARRVCAVFLERDDYEKIQEHVGLVMDDLFMECLRPFVQSRGGEIVYATLFVDEEKAATNPLQHIVKIDGQNRRIVDNGYLFIHFPDEKVIVSVGILDFRGSIVSRIVVRSNKNSVAFFEAWKEFTRAHNYLHGRAFFADGVLIERRKTYSWDEILLAENIKRLIRTHVEGFLYHRHRLKDLGVKARRGLILHGPPGTGKTLLGKVLAETLDCSFMWVSPRHVEGPESFENILALARFVAPTVVFLEDLDLFAEDRDLHDWGGLGELMNQLDGAVDNEDVITIATTNRLEVIEKALRNRPGRFDRVLTLDAMDEVCRRRLLDKLLARATIAPEEVDRLVNATEGYTGAQVEELTNTLYILAVAKGKGGQGNGDGCPSVPVIDAGIIAEAREEFTVELKARMGFHAE